MAVSPQLTTRVTNILKQPAQEWPVIAAEPAVWAAYVGGDDTRSRAVRSFLGRSRKARSARGGRTWTRDELHER